MHDCVQSLAPTLALLREAQLAHFRPKTCAEDFANLAWNFPTRRTLSCPLASAARRCAATLAPVARCTLDPQSPFEPMTDREEPVMTDSLQGYCGTSHLHTKGTVGCPMIAYKAIVGHPICIQRGQWDVP